MASSFILEENCERKMSVEAGTFPSFLTEDMIDAAMNKIQDMEHLGIEEDMIVDDDMLGSGVSSNDDSSEADVRPTLEKNINEEQNCTEKLDDLNLQSNDISVQNKNEISQNREDTKLLNDATSSREVIDQDILENTNTQVNEQLHIGDNIRSETESEVNVLKGSDNQEEIRITEMLIDSGDRDKEKLNTVITNDKDDNEELSNIENNTYKEILLSTDVDEQVVNNEQCKSTHIKIPNYEDHKIGESEKGLDEINFTKDIDEQTTDKENLTNKETTLIKGDHETGNREETNGVDTAVIGDIQNQINKQNSDKLDGMNDKIISSIKEAFNKINTMREKRITDKPSTAEAEKQSKALEIVDMSDKTDCMEEESITNSQIKTRNMIFNMPEIIAGSQSLKEINISNEETENLASSEEGQVDKNYEEEVAIDYEDISDNDECGLEIDDNLEKEMENNLMAEIGLSPQAKKACFVLDDPEVLDDTEDIVEVERREANKLDNESITLYRADDLEATDVSSMVECVLDSSATETVTSPCSNNLIPNTSYSESDNIILQTAQVNNKNKQMKMIHVKGGNQMEMKHWIPVLKKLPNQNKNVQYVLKLNSNLVDNTGNKKLKVVQLQKSLLASRNNSPNNKIIIKDPTFQETLLKNQIVESQLPPYTSSHHAASSTVHRCEECQDTFFLPSSLKHHITRRSVVITYWCRICCVSIKFYNRCLMLKHIRLHKQSVNNIDPSSFELRPLSTELLEFGLPKCVTQEWEENRVKNITSTNSAKKSQIDKPASVLNRLKTLTSIVKIPRNVNQSTQLAGSSTGSILIDHGNKNIDTTKQQDLQNTNNATNAPCGSKDDQSKILKPNNRTINLEKLDIKRNTYRNNSESNFERNMFLESDDETTAEIRIDEVYSINTDATNKTDEKINSAISETVTELQNLLNEKTEENIPRISVKALPMVENDFSNDCEIISLPKKNGIRNKKMDFKDAGVKIKCLSNIKNDNGTKYTYCSECGIKVFDMLRHLNRTNLPTDHNLTCRVCRLILPTRCSLKIHLRFHMKLPPYKCPECGKQFSQFENLYPHLKFECGHLSRLVKYICSKCRKPCSNLVQLESHVFSLHTNRVFKCSLCPVAFFNISSVKKHKSKEHPNVDIFPLSYQQCTLCPDKLIPKGKVSEHVSEHARNPSQLTYAYQCPGCKKWYTSNRTGFVAHLAGCVKVSKEREKFNINEESAAANDNNNSDCLTEEASLLKKCEDNLDDDIIEMCEKDPLSLEDWEGSPEQHVREKRIELCIVCKEEPVIIMPGTDLNKQSLCCKLCVKPVDIESHKSNQFIEKSTNFKSKTDKKANQQTKNNTDIRMTYERKRSSRPIKRKVNLDFEYDTNDYVFGNPPSEKSDSTCSSPESKNKIEAKSKIKFKKSRVDKSFEESGVNFVSGQIVSENKSENVLCSKCGFKANTVAEFRTHVTTHRIDPNAYQCLECGLCFVVRPSLEKHLIVLHRIKNVEEYIRNNDVGGGNCVKNDCGEEIDSGNEDIQENQCRVCYMIFDSPTSLDKHFRTHGMAFLMSSQRQSKKL